MENFEGLHLVQPLQTAQEEAGAEVIPADVQTSMVWLDRTLAFLDARRAISLALAFLDRESREELLEEALAQERAGQPLPSFTSVMADANFWADMASPGELKAYCLACYARMPLAARRAFLALVEGRKAAA